MTAHTREQTQAVASWATADEVLEHLKISRRTLNVWLALAADPIPHHRIGGILRFDIREVDAWLRSRCSTPSASVQAVQP